MVVLGSQVYGGPLHFVLLIHNLQNEKVDFLLACTLRHTVEKSQAKATNEKDHQIQYLSTANTGHAGASDLMRRLSPQIMVPVLG